MIARQSICPECFSKKFYSIDGINWKCLECKYKHKIKLNNTGGKQNAKNTL